MYCRGNHFFVFIAAVFLYPSRFASHFTFAVNNTFFFHALLYTTVSAYCYWPFKDVIWGQHNRPGKIWNDKLKMKNMKSLQLLHCSPNHAILINVCFSACSCVLALFWYSSQYPCALPRGSRFAIPSRVHHLDPHPPNQGQRGSISGRQKLSQQSIKLLHCCSLRFNH